MVSLSLTVQLGESESHEDRALLSALIDSWIHSIHGAICTDSIVGRVYSDSTSPLGEEEYTGTSTEKPGIENLTGVSTYLGRWMDARCLPCDCQFCGVQRASMDCMLTRWDKRVAHRLIEVDGVETIGRVSFWLLANFRKMEVSGDTNGEDLYRINVALCVEVSAEILLLRIPTWSGVLICAVDSTGCSPLCAVGL